MNEQAWKEQAARVLCGADSCWDYDTLPEQRSEISATEDSFCKDYWRKLAAALYPIVQQAIAAERGEPVAVPHVVYDMKMPPYHYQKPYTGSGGSISVPSAPPTEAQIRADERERCAAWLREDEQGRFVEGPEIEETFYNRDDYTGEECTWTEKRKPRRLRTRFDFAEAIERGEHAAIRSLKEADNGAGNECICPKCGLRHGGKVLLTNMTQEDQANGIEAARTFLGQQKGEE